MRKAALSLALLALGGCASTLDFVDRHPVITLIALTSVAMSVPALVHKDNAQPDPDRKYGPPIDPYCLQNPVKCQ